MSAIAAAKHDIPSLRDRVSPGEWDARVQLAAAYRLVHMHGWQQSLIYTHISARVPGEDGHILLNPFGLRYDEVTASNLVKIDLDGKILDDTPYKINQAGYCIHSAIHAARPEVACVLHTHSEDGIAVSSLEEGLIFTHQEALMFYGVTAYHDFEGIALDLDERERLVRDIGDNMVLVLRNHGLLTVGRTIGEAYTLMFFLEKVCSAQLKTMTTGGRINPIPEEVMERTAGQFDVRNCVCGEREWAAMRRMLDETDSNYMQ